MKEYRFWNFSRLLTLLLILSGSSAGLAQTPQVLVSSNSTWKFFRGTNEASVPPTEWRTNTFDDSAWEVGNSPFYFGYSPASGTLLSDMRSNYTCIFLRHTFMLTNASEFISLSNRPWADDGYIAWINGVEVRRQNMGALGSFVPFDGNALSSVFFTGAAQINAFTNALVTGLNVMALQVFNVNSNDADFFANPELTGAVVDTIPPAVLSTVPAQNILVASLPQITVTFTEPVFGVNAQDLIVNGQPASSVATVNSSTYTFSFPPIPYGTVQVYWDANQVIRDFSGLRMIEASNTWTYLLMDTLPPTVSTLTPAAGATIASLSSVEVLFDEPVSGLDAGVLLINGQAATSVFGSGAGPYIFQFPQPAAGTVQFAWTAGNNIQDLAPAPNAFAGGSWTVTVNPTLFAGDIIINEFLAANILTNVPQDLDENGELQDWIELYNRGTNSVRLLGWSLTTDPQIPRMWTFPNVSLGAGQYLLVYASGKDRTPTNGARLHTNFKLNVNGEYLALLSADSPRRVASEFTPNYPEQRNDYSYGLTASGWRYFQTPTPGAANGASAITQVIPKLHVNVARGAFDTPFNLIVSCDVPGATLRYTRDGSEPTALTPNTYSGPILITNTTIFRVAAFMANMLPTRVSSHTYLFHDQVIRQPQNPAGYPTTWGTFGSFIAPADYEMDPEIVTNSAYANLMKPSLAALPVLSVALSVDDMFGPSRGIYTHPEPADNVRAQWERPASVELIGNEGESGFQVDCGIRIQGNASRTPSKTPKHPFRLLFKGDYGEGKLNYQFYPDSPVESFDNIVLRADFNNSWTHWDPNQRLRGSRVRDAWGKDTFRDMGQPGGHSRYFHLFINGIYWGVYDASERIDSDFGANYLGGQPEEFDVMASKPTEAIDGTIAAYNTMIANVRNKDMRQLTNYAAALTYVDMTNFVDYMLLNFYGANLDWGFDGNWNALRRRAPGELFKYIAWDCEQLVVNTGDNRVSAVTDLPSGLHSNLINSLEYKLFFADRVQKHMFNGGALTTNQLIPRWNNRANVLSTAIISESARWGDYERDVVQGVAGSSSTGPYLLYTRNDHWTPEWNRMTTSYFPARGATVLSQLTTAGLFPTVAAPTFNQFGGRVPVNFLLTMSAANTIYFTTNGTDPREFGTGAVSPLARAYIGGIGINSAMTVKARALSGTNWSALTEANFAGAALGVPLRITEIMYNPAGGNAYEYIELQNVGVTPLNIGGYSFINIDFVFPFGYILSPGQRIVLGSSANTNFFKARYPGVAVAGWFDGALSNGGEKISVLDTALRTVISVDYGDGGGWPTSPDGLGYSLEIINVNGDFNDPANWRASEVQNGTPGQPNGTSSANDITLNEVMAENLTAVNNGGTYPDWVELHNSGASAVDLANWSLSDDGNPVKFVFPAGTLISAGGYLVVWCDATTNMSPGIHTGISLGRNGDSVFLYDPAGARIDAISFGPQVANLTVGRIGNVWTLTTPTPNTANASATLASPTSLVINEFLANSAPGSDDWVELFNTSTSPVLLRDIYLGTSSALFQIRSLSFVPPRGYVQLIADENSGPDHLNFKLSASAGVIVLYDNTGSEVQRVTYGPQVQGTSSGRLPDGNASIVVFTNSASPAASNYLANYTGPVLNELLARNSSAVVSPWGNYADYLEIYNASGTPFNVGGMGLSDEAGNVKFLFPPNAMIAANGYLIVWCDGDHAPSTAGNLNTGFALSGSSGAVYLFNALGQLVNSVEYGFQINDLPIGLSGGQWRLLSAPTPGAANAATATLGSTSNLRINEWMAAAGNGEDDWFELYNSDSLPVNMAGLYLTDDLSLSGQSNTPIAALSFIAAKGWVKWIADESPSQGSDHARFDLDKDTDNIRLYAANFSIIDSVSFGAQMEGVSQGRLPDGGTNIVSFPGTPTPEKSNYVPLQNVVINEVLTHTDPPLEDAIEIQNTGTNAAAIGGWWISNSQRDFKKFRIPAGTTIEPGEFKVFYENQFNADGSGTGTNFTLNSAHGDAVYLSEADGAGNLTGYRAAVEFGAAANGVSFGRFLTSAGADFTAMEQRTFGSDNPATLAQFRTGQGALNSYPLVGPVIINEIMYHPVNGTNLTEIANEEFVELYNVTANPVPLFDANNPANGWKLDGGVTFAFSNITIAAHEYLILVAFDPATNALALFNFRSKYGNNGTVLGPLHGQLNNSGEALELYKPDAPQQAPHPDAGYVPSVLVDRVSYDELAPWPSAADGGGASLQRINPGLYGNDPANWKAESPTAGAINTQSGLVPPIITSQPANQAVPQNGSASFTVVAEGTVPISYQWQHAGTNLPGATAAMFTVINARLSDAGLYRCIVTNVAGLIASHDAVFTVLAAPTINVSPQSQIVVAGSQVQFSVSAIGTAPLRYQWRRDDGDLPGQTSAELTLNNVQPVNAGNYTVLITNGVGSVTSVVAVLVVNVPPSITSDPTNVTVMLNSSATFAVAATGTAPLAYQWRKDGINIPGANGSSFTILAAQLSDQAMYSVLVTNIAGQASSLGAQLRVNVTPFLLGPHVRFDGAFEFSLNGQANRNYTIQSSTNLSSWTDVTNMMLGTSAAAVVDTSATNTASRFYRVRLNP